MFSTKKYIIYTFITIFVSCFLAAHVSALTYQQDIGVNFTFNKVLRLTLSSDIYIHNLAPGTVSDSNIINVNVLTNSVAGYTLNATVGNDTTYNTRNLIHSNTNLSDNFASIDYSASPTISSNTNLANDKWAFSFSTDNGTNWSNYNGLPLYSDTTNIATLKETNGPVASEAGDNVKFKIAAKASDTKVSGEYNNVINFDLTTKVLPQYTVHFNNNGGYWTMPDQIIFIDEPTNLAPNSFSPPTGFTFGGWNTETDGSGTAYSNQQSVTNLVAAGGEITLYAQWERKTIANAVYLQDVEYCPASLVTGQVYTLTDSRDDSVYSVAKLADGNCWFLDNLMLDLVNSTVAAGIDSTNTNADDASLDCLLGRATGCTSPHSTAAVAVSYPSSTPKGVIQNSYKNTTVTNYGAGNGKVGIYYDMCAASAGTYCYGTDGGIDVPDTLYDLGGDICPTGWHIPTGGSSGEYMALYSAYSNSLSNIRQPFSVTYAGWYNQDYQNPPQSQNVVMNIWSSTYGSPSAVYFLGVNANRFVVSSDEWRKDIALPVRCIFNATSE